MKNASSLKSKPETPKTPGGISKSLLTPCRRVGLSRNWRKSVASPFNSPLASTEAKQDNVESRKRKEHLVETPQKENDCDEPENVGTPTRKVDLPRRKKSKTLLNSITETTEDNSTQPEKERCVDENVLRDIETESVEEISKIVSTPKSKKSKSKSKVEVSINKNEDLQIVSIPVHSNFKIKKTLPQIKSMPSKAKETDTSTTGRGNKGMDVKKDNLEHSNKLNKSKPMEFNLARTEKENAEKDVESKNKENSPNNLTKECVVVIQKKIFKKQLKEKELIKVTDKNEDVKQNPVSQALFNDSDSDEVPLNHLKTETKNDVETVTIDDDNDFETSKPKLKKTISKTSIKNKTNNSKAKTVPKENTKTVNAVVHKTPSQNSMEDDDDFFEKRTILIRKTYEKVTKPIKAKSTGSITQKDIEDLKARIETKKKMLLAKSMTDTKELRELIKKWQKGCQDALMELMDLMKNKCPDQNMEYSKILQTLKIPATLVGYDSDTDCFVTPDDDNIILSHIKE